MSPDLSLMTNDLAGLALGSLVGLVLLLLPGALLAQGMQQLAPQTDWRAFAPALAIALLPIVDSVLIRLGGVATAICLRVLLAAATLIWARGFIPRWTWITVAAAGAWWLYLAFIYVDVDVGGSLYQSITVLDLTKHAAVVREIGSSGLPLRDPFFDRPQAAGYYHYFYDGAALIDVVLGRAVDARMAFVAAAFNIGIALATFLRALVVDLDWQRASERRLTVAVIIACAIGGLDLLGILGRFLASGALEANAEWWDDEISFVPTAASWVPHHLAGVIAMWVALLLLSKAATATGRRAAALAAVAGLAMANAFGLSVWVTIGGVFVLAAALRVLKADVRLRWLVLVAMAGTVALLLSSVQLIDLLHGRTDGRFPLAPWIREPADLGALLGAPISPLLALALTPLVWAMEFGAFAIGSWVFWRGRWPSSSVLARLMTAAVVAGLLMNLLLRSAIINNDFGWRVIWFAQLPAMLWTIAVLQRKIEKPALRSAMLLAVGLGFAATLYNGLAARWVRPPLARHQFNYINAHPAEDYALAKAYRWANEHLPADTVLQHNPLGAPRVFDFGLYSVHQVAVADSQAELFGAPREALAARLAFYGMIFAGKLDPASAKNVRLVVTSRDPLWQTLSSAQCAFRSNQVCITKGVGQ